MQTDLTGTYRAVVVNTKDPTHKGRVRVKAPQVAGNAELQWAESVNSAFPVPAVNTIVWIMFDGGYINKPIYIPNSKEEEEQLVWSTASLSTGYTHNGNGQGNVQWTTYAMRGQRWVEWRGGMNVAQTGTTGSWTMPSGGIFETLTDSLVIPPVKRVLSVAQNYFGGTTPTVKIDFNPTGDCVLVGSVSVETNWVSFNNVRYTV